MTKATIAFTDGSYGSRGQRQLFIEGLHENELIFFEDLTKSYLAYLMHGTSMLPTGFLKIITSNSKTDRYEAKEAPGVVARNKIPQPSDDPMIDSSTINLEFDIEAHGGIREEKHVIAAFTPGGIYPERNDLQTYIKNGEIVDLQDGRLCCPTELVLNALKESVEKHFFNSIGILLQTCKSNLLLKNLTENQRKNILPVGAVLTAITSEETGFHNQQLLRGCSEFIRENNLQSNTRPFLYITAALLEPTVPLQITATRHVEGENNNYIRYAEHSTTGSITYKSLSDIANNLGLGPWDILANFVIANDIGQFINQFHVMLKEIFSQLGYQLAFIDTVNGKQNLTKIIKELLQKTDFTSSSDYLEESSIGFKNILEKFLNGKLTKEDIESLKRSRTFNREVRAHISPYSLWNFVVSNPSYFDLEQGGRKIVTDSLIGSPNPESPDNNAQQEDMHRKLVDIFEKQGRQASEGIVEKLLNALKEFFRQSPRDDSVQNAAAAVLPSKTVSRRQSRRQPVALTHHEPTPADIAFCAWYREPPKVAEEQFKKALTICLECLFPDTDNWQMDYVTATILERYVSQLGHFPNSVLNNKNLAEHIVALHNLGHEGLVIKLLNQCKTNPGTLITSLRNRIPALLLNENNAIDPYCQERLQKDEKAFLREFFDCCSKDLGVSIMADSSKTEISKLAFATMYYADGIKDMLSTKSLSELFTDEFKAQLGIKETGAQAKAGKYSFVARLAASQAATASAASAAPAAPAATRAR
jgi:hypothetical protein